MQNNLLSKEELKDEIERQELKNVLKINCVELYAKNNWFYLQWGFEYQNHVLINLILIFPSDLL